MSTLAGYAYHPQSGNRVEIYEGWNWPAFFFGFIWCLVKEMWSTAAVVFVIGCISLLIPVLGWMIVIGMWCYLGASGNELYAKSLLKKGYLTEVQYNESSEPSSLETPIRLEKQSAQPSSKSEPNIIDNLERLQSLRASGALSEDEFQAQKAKLLG